MAFTLRVGAALARQRRLKGLSQQQVGESIGVEPETISRMETGVISPTLKRLCQLAQVLDCPVEHLMGEASLQPQSLLNRLGERLSELPEHERGFVIQHSLELASWLAGRDELRRLGSMGSWGDQDKLLEFPVKQADKRTGMHTDKRTDSDQRIDLSRDEQDGPLSP